MADKSAPSPAPGSSRTSVPEPKKKFFSSRNRDVHFDANKMFNRMSKGRTMVLPLHRVRHEIKEQPAIKIQKIRIQARDEKTNPKAKVKAVNDISARPFEEKSGVSPTNQSNSQSYKLAPYTWSQPTLSPPVPSETSNQQSPVKAEKPVKVEKPIRVEKPIKVEKPVKAEKPIKVEKPVKIEKPIETEKPAVTTMRRTRRAAQSQEIVEPSPLNEDIKFYCDSSDKNKPSSTSPSLVNSDLIPPPISPETCSPNIAEKRAASPVPAPSPPEPQKIIKPKKKFFSSKNRNLQFDANRMYKAGDDSGAGFSFDDEPGGSTTNQTNSQPYKLASYSWSQPALAPAVSSGTSSQQSALAFEEPPEIKLRRVRKAAQCHDLGETAHFNEDIKFYLDSIDKNKTLNTVRTRCLSILGLAQQTMQVEFRMHLRAHDLMPRIISALTDTPQDPNLALCSATLIFVYSQDRLTMDIDAKALQLMLNLLETRTDEEHSDQVEASLRQRVKDLCQTMKNKGYAKYLNLELITASKLAMETLLGLTSKRAGDWFKEELRKLKGIDFIVNTVINEVDEVIGEREPEDSKFSDGQIDKIDRCLRVLENITFQHKENQDYILNYEDSALVSTCMSILRACKHEIIASTEAKHFHNALLSTLRVLIHLSSQNVHGSSVIGDFPEAFEFFMESLFHLPSFLYPEMRFDLIVLLLCLLIELIEFHPPLRRKLLQDSRGKHLKQIVEMLFKRFEEAQKTDEEADVILESHKTSQERMTEALQESILTQVLAESGKNMEHSIVAACVSLLLGCAIQDNSTYIELVRNSVPGNSFEPMIEVLRKLHEFARLADIMTVSGVKRVEKILNLFKELQRCNSINSN